MRRSYIRAISEGAASKGVPVLRPPALRIWPLQPLSGYEDKHAPFSDETLVPLAQQIGPSSAPQSESRFERTNPRQFLTHEIDDATSGNDQFTHRESVPLRPISTESRASSANNKEQAALRPIHQSPASSRLPHGQTSQQESVRELQNKPNAASYVSSNLNAADAIPAQPDLRPLQEGQISRRESRSDQTEAVSTTSSSGLTQKHSTVSSQAERSADEPRPSKPRLPDSVDLPTFAARVQSVQSGQRPVQPSTSAKVNSTQPLIKAANPPAPPPEKSLPRLSPDEDSSANKKIAYTPDLKEAYQPKGARNTVRIGTIEIHLAPAPPAPIPAPRPVIRQSAASPASALARGYTSQFGLRQG
jgi:hypothetical protein